jgi:hypothetical protein
MVVLMISTIKNYVGLSTDTKPTTNTPPGSTFWEYDTNILYKSYDGTNWEPYEVKSIILPGTVDLHQAAGTYDLFAATGGTVEVEKFILTLPNIDCSDDVALTGISVQTNTTPVITLISAAQGAKANLTPLASFSYAVPFALPVTKKIQLTIIGGTATADPTTCTISAKYQALTAGAYLA